MRRAVSISTKKPYAFKRVCKACARPRIGGIRSSPRRVLRLMRENPLLCHQRKSPPPGPKEHNGTIIPKSVDVMWGSDMIRVYLGMEASPAYVRSPQCNGCAERFIKTLKENLLWLRTFESIDDLCQALQEFKQQHNESWIIEKHNYKTPKRVREQCLNTIKTAA